MIPKIGENYKIEKVVMEYGRVTTLFLVNPDTNERFKVRPEGIVYHNHEVDAWLGIKALLPDE